MGRHTTLRLIQPDVETVKSEPPTAALGVRTSKVLAQTWKELVIGQDDVIDRICPYVNRYISRLSVPRKPVGSMMLLGPTGSGKTYTVEALAKLLHNDHNKLVTIHCAEYTLEHEVAKILGAPPGYLGYKEMGNAITQKRLNDCTSKDCDLSIILFDEIEKAHYSLFKLLLGMLDKATLGLGNGDNVSLEKSIIFFTSNVGASEMMSLLTPTFGFERTNITITDSVMSSLMNISDNAFKKMVTPEFANRLDERIMFRPLSEKDLYRIMELELQSIQRHITDRLSSGAFNICYSTPVLKFLTEEGKDIKYGARALKRAITKHVFNPITDAYLDGDIDSGDTAKLYVKGNSIGWKIVRKGHKEEETVA